MGKRYAVHARHDTTVDVPTRTPEGHEITGQMPCALIELVPVDPRDHHTVTRREIMPNKDAQKHVAETFPVGGIVEEGEFKLVATPEDVKAAAEKAAADAAAQKAQGE